MGMMAFPFDRFGNRFREGGASGLQTLFSPLWPWAFWFQGRPLLCGSGSLVSVLLQLVFSSGEPN